MSIKQAILATLLGIHLVSILFGLVNENWAQVGISSNAALIVLLYVRILENGKDS